MPTIKNARTTFGKKTESNVKQSTKTTAPSIFEDKFISTTALSLSIVINKTLNNTDKQNASKTLCS